MDHVAILTKSWGLIPKILSGEKTIESRWYKTRRVPWDKIKKGDVVYFKNSGEPVRLKARVVKVDQHKVSNNKEALSLMRKYSINDLGTGEIPKEIKTYILGKKYAIFIHFDSVQEINPFNIDKTGYGAMSAWICTNNIRYIKLRV